jgi:hypothetical protein
MSDSEERLGKDGSDQIKRHPFFFGVDWNNIRSSKPPFTPDNGSLTKNFDKFEEVEPWYKLTEEKKGKVNKKVKFNLI